MCDFLLVIKSIVTHALILLLPEVQGFSMNDLGLELSISFNLKSNDAVGFLIYELLLD